MAKGDQLPMDEKLEASARAERERLVVIAETAINDAVAGVQDAERTLRLARKAERDARAARARL